MKVTEDDVRKMASLSMFEISDNEIEMFRSNLEAILQHVMKLNELDTDGVEPTTYILKQQNIFREDIPKPYENTEELLSNAPFKDDSAFIVPKVVE